MPHLKFFFYLFITGAGALVQFREKRESIIKGIWTFDANEFVLDL